MKVLYLSPIGQMGGAERCLANVMAAVRNVRPEAQLELICATDGPLISLAKSIGVRATVIPMPSELAELGDSTLFRSHRYSESIRLLGQALAALPASRRYLAQLRESVAEINPDLIHSNGLKTHLLSALMRRGSCPTVWHMHDFLGSRVAMSRLLRLAAVRCSGVISISDAIARDTRAVLPHTATQVIYNAIDVGHFAPLTKPEESGALEPSGTGLNSANKIADLDALAEMPPASAQTIRVGLVATYARWKGQDLLIDAMGEFFQQHSEAKVRFYIVGGPIYHTRNSQFTEAELRQRSQRLGVEDRIGWVGFQPDPLAVYRALDIVVHASTRPEPFGLTVAEAMACGKPTIVSQAGGAAGLFSPDVDAVGVAPGDAHALANAIAQLVADPEQRARLGRNARQTAVRRFNSDRVGREVLDFYQQIWDRGAISLRS